MASTSLLPSTNRFTPADQLAPTMLTLAKGAGGSQQMTVSLQPAELGMVKVTIARAVSGATQIQITAEKPLTLLALQRDQLQLHRTLDEAGIPSAGRTISFHVAPPVQTAAGSSSSPSWQRHDGTSPDTGGRGGPDADGASGGGPGSNPARERNTYSTSRRSDPAPTPGANSWAPGQTYRVGLDITA
ncbi:MAG TPA: flagellar hook-length control protein FliK [Rhodopila sp.]